MRRWTMSVVEPSLDDLLDDEIMIPVIRSAGLSPEQLREELRRAACRLSGLKAKPPKENGCCWAHA
ncbi:MAG TPA: hypothetical protein VGZ72_15590 [Stellaceae bacterium]|nr:hypothetical protein [Stellaceae bacterium]